MSDMIDYISVNEAADRAHVHDRTVRRWFREDKLTRHKDGRGRVWVDPEELARLTTPHPVGTAVR